MGASLSFHCLYFLSSLGVVFYYYYYFWPLDNNNNTGGAICFPFLWLMVEINLRC